MKNIDIPSYLPSNELAPDDIYKLCCTIFEKRSSIKQSLRKGVWMHLVGVFPPELKAREQRERYMEKLRMVYDTLKGIYLFFSFFFFSFLRYLRNIVYTYMYVLIHYWQSKHFNLLFKCVPNH